MSDVNLRPSSHGTVLHSFSVFICHTERSRGRMETAALLKKKELLGFLERSCQLHVRNQFHSSQMQRSSCLPRRVPELTR